MVRFLKTAISKAFLKLLDRRQIYLIVKPEGQALVELEDAEIDAGIRPPRELPPVPKSAEQILREQVIEDFKTLPTAKFKIKINGNTDYRAMFERLSASSELTLHATTLTNAGQVGG